MKNEMGGRIGGEKRNETKQNETNIKKEGECKLKLKLKLKIEN